MPQVSATIGFLPEEALHTSIFVVDRARNFATKALDGQVHRDGLSAIEHSRRVAERFSDPILVSIAYLHDVVEDSPVSVQAIREEFGHEIADGVDAMTRGRVEPWGAYIRRVEMSPHAILVKIADIEDNIARCVETDRMYEKLPMYRKTLTRLRRLLPEGAPISFQGRE